MSEDVQGLGHNLSWDLEAGHLRAILQVDLGCDLVGACTQQAHCNRQAMEFFLGSQ